MPVAANTFTAVELRRSAALDELCDQDGKLCAPEILHASFFAESALRENEESSTVFAVGKGENQEGHGLLNTGQRAWARTARLHAVVPWRNGSAAWDCDGASVERR